MKYALFTIFALITILASAQGRVQVNQPYDVEQMIYRHAEFVDEAKTEGWRIQLMATRDQSEAELTKADFILFTEAVDAYVEFTPPEYKVKAGDFLYRYQALYWLNLIRDTYPIAFIVRDRVNISEAQ